MRKVVSPEAKPFNQKFALNRIYFALPPKANAEGKFEQRKNQKYMDIRKILIVNPHAAAI